MTCVVQNFLKMRLKSSTLYGCFLNVHCRRHLSVLRPVNSAGFMCPVTANTSSKRFTNDGGNDGQKQNNNSATDSNETHGQPLHRFGSSTKLEQAANRFDVGESVNSYSDFQHDLPQSPDNHVDVYNHVPSVNLSGCMQSQVPHPYARMPTHMNMPGGINRREDKYLQGHLSDLTAKREYSTTTSSRNVGKSNKLALDEHGNPTYTPVATILSSPCPQGIQGDDCAQFKLWLSNCLKQDVNKIECEKLANEYIAGRKTLSQIFAEYDLIISQPVQADSKVNANTTSVDSSNASSASVPQTQRSKLKNAVRDYGSTVIVFHVTISLASLGLFYTLVASNIDIVSLMEYLNVTAISKQTLGTASTFAVAYAVHKVFAPVRIAITLTCVPFIVRALRARGFLKK